MKELQDYETQSALHVRYQQSHDGNRCDGNSVLEQHQDDGEGGRVGSEKSPVPTQVNGGVGKSRTKPAQHRIQRAPDWVFFSSSIRLAREFLFFSREIHSC